MSEFKLKKFFKKVSDTFTKHVDVDLESGFVLISPLSLKGKIACFFLELVWDEFHKRSASGKGYLIRVPREVQEATDRLSDYEEIKKTKDEIEELIEKNDTSDIKEIIKDEVKGAVVENLFNRIRLLR